MVPYVQTGEMIDYTPSGAVTGGDVVVIGEIVAVAKHDIPAGELGAVGIKGVFRFPKGTGSASALAAGTKVFWDAVNAVVTATAGANKCAGYTVKAASADDDTVDVDLCRA
jgi:predicted RecA/RadA family phage recombinase